MNDVMVYQWVLVIASSLLLLLIAPYSKTAGAFFSGLTQQNQQPGFFMLTSSLIISWIFAKSITNAANLGLSFGIVGGLAYSAYYFSFLAAGIIIYLLRTKGGFSSLHHFLQNKYGKGAVLLFSVLIVIRLFNEVWSNTMVIGTYFGETGSIPYYSAIVVFTTLTLAYALKGGLRSSLLTDLIQMILFGILLFVILTILIPGSSRPVSDYLSSGEWKMASGLNLLFAALLQMFSYPFHDPVLTDRGFISSPATTLKSFMAAAIFGGLLILLFSTVGIYANFQGLEGQAAVEVSKMIGGIMMLLINFIMITSAASTLDSSFASFSKLVSVDLGKSTSLTVTKGRLTMIIVAVAGTVPIFFSPAILSATTISGTMVIGLAPVFLFWHIKTPSVSFHLSVIAGILTGLMLATGTYPNELVFCKGSYGPLLSLNILGTAVCFALFFIPKWLMHYGIISNNKYRRTTRQGIGIWRALQQSSST